MPEYVNKPCPTSQKTRIQCFGIKEERTNLKTDLPVCVMKDREHNRSILIISCTSQKSSLIQTNETKFLFIETLFLTTATPII